MIGDSTSWYDTGFSSAMPPQQGHMFEMDLSDVLMQEQNFGDPNGQAIDWAQWDAILSAGFNVG